MQISRDKLCLCRQLIDDREYCSHVGTPQNYKFMGEIDYSRKKHHKKPIQANINSEIN